MNQRVWAAPRKLARKPATLGFLLMPCVLGWQQFESLSGRSGFGVFPLPRGPMRYQVLFAYLAIGYNVWLAYTGPDKQNVRRSLETAYGAAKVFLAVQLSLFLWEHAVLPDRLFNLLDRLFGDSSL